ncbi:MAG: EamA family transporter [Proteobacteria bacterium]|jgi:drug/metabolite transporter (DMT)-like permease|nr:EamA family transporter [Pseudomonadota bacterium]MBT4107062.1 EamA family transporter [Pseudomonadota bacterium]MBT4987575.1 EamA family transporter [Pseudomonadota bacterium]MBT6066554.1 EamA family transporter [Pseudomonadota bacterium]MBT6656896.1 EamA family transporter [Pseudomonadota bacterium]
MTLLITFLVLFAALLHASWNAFVKSGQDKLLTVALMHACSGGLAFCLLPFLPLPDTAAWPFLALSSVLHWGYYFFLVSGYRHGDLGVIYPLARGSAPLMIAISGAFIAGETFSPLAMTGLGLASVGIISLSFEKGLPKRKHFKAISFALGTGIWITAYTLADGLGVRESGSKLSYIAWLFVLEAITFCPFVLFLRRTTWKRYYVNNWRGLWLSGVVSGSAYGLVIYVMSTHPMAAVSALRETSVVIAVLIGTFILKEQHMTYRICAAAVVVAGIALMNATI